MSQRRSAGASAAWALAPGAVRPPGVPTRLWRVLAAGPANEARLQQALPARPGLDAATAVAAALFQLQRAGALQEGLLGAGPAVLWRAPVEAFVRPPPARSGAWQWASGLLLLRDAAGPWIRQPGTPWRLRWGGPGPGWAALAQATAGPRALWIQRLRRQGLPGAQAFEWLREAGVLEPAGATASDEWPLHERLMQLQTRRGWGQTPGKQPHTPAPSRPGPGLAEAARRLPPMGDAPQALRALESLLAQRRSRRDHAAERMPWARLSAWLAATLGALGRGAQDREDRGVAARRRHPSGGSVYAVHAFVVAHRVDALARGMWRFDLAQHALWPLQGEPAALDALLDDAAAAAAQPRRPAVLVVLAADRRAMQQAYGGLSLALLIKEAGALLQLAQLAAAALDLACCPLGTGDASAFARATGLAADDWMPVAELSLGEPATPL